MILNLNGFLVLISNLVLLRWYFLILEQVEVYQLSIIADIMVVVMLKSLIVESLER